MKHVLLAAALTCVVLPIPATAQLIPAALTARVVKAPPNPCDPAATHRVDCTQILLRSSSVDLTQFENTIVDLTGTVFGLGCTTIDVTTAAAAAVRTTQLAPFGTRLGRTIFITTTAPAGSLVLFLFDVGTTFLPLGPFGTLLVSPLTSILIGPDISIGIALRTLPIPNDPNLIGLTVVYQTGYLSLTPQIDGRLLNLNCVTVQA
jgi:hypothetical protein